MSEFRQAAMEALQARIERLEQRIEDERHAHRDTANERNQLAGDVTTLTSRVRQLEEALKEIANNPHNVYPDKTEPYTIGVVDGHRCASSIARKALGPNWYKAALAGKETP